MATSAKVKKPTKVSVKTVVKKDKKPSKWSRPFRAPFTYIKGAWVELRQVRWPNRRATWGLTVAVILFSLFFAIIIVVLDFAFNYLFKEVLL